MITIQNGKLMIPDSDRFVGFAGDNTVNTKQFTMIDFTQENCAFTLCMRFDDDTVRSVPLSAHRDHAQPCQSLRNRRNLVRCGAIH